MKKILSFVMLAFVLGLFVPQLEAGQNDSSSQYETPAKARVKGKAKAKTKAGSEKKHRRNRKQAKHARHHGRAIKTHLSV